MYLWLTYGMPQDRDQDQDLNPIEERILQFVKDNPGKSKSDIVRYLKDRHIAPRIATLAHIDWLESKKMIICQLENPNSQIYKIYINKDNRLSSVLVELEEFKEAYLNLLEASRNIINNKDYSPKTLGITEPDPTKWSKSDKIKYFHEYDILREYSNVSKKLPILYIYKKSKQIQIEDNISRITQHRDEILQTNKERTQNPQLERVSQIMTKDKATLTQHIDEVSQINQECKSMLKTLRDESKSLIGGMTHMIFGPVILFHTMADIIFYRSILRWSSIDTDANLDLDRNRDIDRDREFLPQLYAIVYRKISIIQLELSRFIKSIKFGFDFSKIMDYNKIMVGVRNNKDFNLSTFVGLYYSANMGSEIQQVVNALIKLSEEVKDLKLIKLDNNVYQSLDERENEIVKIIDNSENIKNKLVKTLVDFEGIENKINSRK